MLDILPHTHGEATQAECHSNQGIRQLVTLGSLQELGVSFFSTLPSVTLYCQLPVGHRETIFTMAIGNVANQKQLK